MFTILPERPEHAAVIPALLDAAFGPDRLAKRSYHYRKGIRRLRDLAFVAVDPAGGVVGTIDFWPVRVGEAGRPALLLGPLAVEPALKGGGIGRALVRHGMARAAALGHRAVLLVGDLDYYARFGFAHASGFGVAMPGESPARLLAAALLPGGLDGLSGAITRRDEPSARAGRAPGPSFAPAPAA